MVSSNFQKTDAKHDILLLKPTDAMKYGARLNANPQARVDSYPVWQGRIGIYSFASSFTVPTLSLAPYFFSTPSLWY